MSNTRRTPIRVWLKVFLRAPRKLMRLGLRGTFDWARRILRRELWGVPDLRYARITEQLYVGEQFKRRGWRALQREGVTAVINMRGEYDDLKLGIDIPTYHHIPTTDLLPPTVEQLREGVRAITGAIARGEKVYIHCRAGEGRAPTTAASYLISTGMAVDEAVETIRAARPFIDVTPPQLARLHEFAETFDKA